MGPIGSQTRPARKFADLCFYKYNTKLKYNQIFFTPKEFLILSIWISLYFHLNILIVLEHRESIGLASYKQSVNSDNMDGRLTYHQRQYALEAKWMLLPCASFCGPLMLHFLSTTSWNLSKTHLCFFSFHWVFSLQISSPIVTRNVLLSDKLFFLLSSAESATYHNSPISGVLLVWGSLPFLPTLPQVLSFHLFFLKCTIVSLCCYCHVCCLLPVVLSSHSF